MTKKIDYVISSTILVFGILYSAFTFTWQQFGLENAYFPGVSMMFLICAGTNLLRCYDGHRTLVICSVFTNVITLGYSCYITYLVNLEAFVLPPYIATSCVALSLCLSLIAQQNTRDTLQT